MQTLRMSALNKIREGVTTIEEVTASRGGLTRVGQKIEDGQPTPAPQGDGREGRERPAHHPARRRSCASTASWCRSRCRR
jgi:hypothetical protein